MNTEIDDNRDESEDDMEGDLYPTIWLQLLSSMVK